MSQSRIDAFFKPKKLSKTTESSPQKDVPVKTKKDQNKNLFQDSKIVSVASSYVFSKLMSKNIQAHFYICILNDW